jgi:hypothetical protein
MPNYEEEIKIPEKEKSLLISEEFFRMPYLLCKYSEALIID